MMKRTAAVMRPRAGGRHDGLQRGFEGSGSRRQPAAGAGHAPGRSVGSGSGRSGREKAEARLADGVYTGTGKGMEGLVTVKLLVQDNRISCLETAQEASQGREATGHPRFAAAVRPRKAPSIDDQRRHHHRRASGRRWRTRSQAEATAAKQERGIR
ncbi:MAG: FMN-binding protein [Eggerthellaceae bacterium]